LHYFGVLCFLHDSLHIVPLRLEATIGFGRDRDRPALDGAQSYPRSIATSRRVRLTVRDVGVGLDAQSMNELFDAFYTTKTDGMGIGLW